MCEQNNESLGKSSCQTHPIKPSSDFCDQWSVLDNIDEEALKKLILEFGIELQHELPELKGSLHLTVASLEEEDPER